MKQIKQISIGMLLGVSLLMGTYSFALNNESPTLIEQQDKKDKSKKNSSSKDDKKKKKSGSRTRTYTPPKKDK